MPSATEMLFRKVCVVNKACSVIGYMDGFIDHYRVVGGDILMVAMEAYYGTGGYRCGGEKGDFTIQLRENLYH